MPRTWAKVAPPTDVDIGSTEQSDDTDLYEAVVAPSAESEGGSGQSSRPWKIRMKNPPDAKPPEPPYHDLPWLFESREAAETAICDWKNGSIDADVTAGENNEGC
ncbi:MAG: hypothetical protein QOG21_2000 [Actinomycetota bacterium]|nr:hypothetical protein [Actinomycetota bacterium]